MKISQNMRQEIWRFDRSCPGPAKRNQLGMEQFAKFEATGKTPEESDPYFLRLLDGKRWWEWTLNEYLKVCNQAAAGDGLCWDGWFQLAKDFVDDINGFKQLRQRLKTKPMTPKQYLDALEINNLAI